MENRGPLGNLGDQFVRTVLRSPLHFLVSDRSMLITVRGSKTGKPYTSPVNYWRRDNLITIVSLRRRMWWRNLRGGDQVSLRLKGREVNGIGTVIEDEKAVAAALAATFSGMRRPPRRYRDPAAAAKARVIVQVKLQPLSQ